MDSCNSVAQPGKAITRPVSVYIGADQVDGTQRPSLPVEKVPSQQKRIAEGVDIARRRIDGTVNLPAIHPGVQISVRSLLLVDFAAKPIRRRKVHDSFHGCNRGHIVQYLAKDKTGLWQGLSADVFGQTLRYNDQRPCCHGRNPRSIHHLMDRRMPSSRPIPGR